NTGTGDLEIKCWNGPTYQRPPFTLLTAPGITPVAPSVDVREAGTIMLNPPSATLPAIAYQYELERYADGTGPDGDTPASASPLESTSFEQDAGDASPTALIAIGTAGSELSVTARAQDRVGRWSEWGPSPAVDIISAEFAPLFTVNPAATGTATVG